jgi:signal peptidase
MEVRLRRRYGIATLAVAHIRWLWAPAAAVLLAVLLPLAVFLVAMLLSGHHLEAVQTGSMQPTYPVGSLLVVEPIDPSDVRVGMPLSFVSPDTNAFVTHRVVAVLDQPDGLFFRTQGDANATADPSPVPARAVRGRVRWAVPRIGDAMVWFAWPRGFILLVVTPTLILVLAEARDRRRTRAEVRAGTLA